MSGVVNAPPINLRFKPQTPARVIHLIKRQFSKYVLDESDAAEDWFETELHKEISSRMTPGDYLRNLREAQTITQKTLAEQIRIRVNYLSDLETGQRSISKAMAKKLAAVFNVTPAVFI
jgi:ribosome-binding protein aMBF1 (putative translation factor)